MIADRLKNGEENKPSFGIEIEMFKATVGLFFDTDDLVRYLTTNFEIEIDPEEFSKTARAEAGAVYDKHGVPYFYMLFHSSDPMIGIVAHESVHVAVALCDNLGVPVEAGCDETLAYMVDYLTQTTIDTIRDFHGVQVCQR